MLFSSEPIVDPDRDERAEAQQKHEDLAPRGRLVTGTWGLGVWGRSLLRRDLVFRIHGSTPSIALSRVPATFGTTGAISIGIQGKGYNANWGIGKSLRLSVISTSLCSNAVAAMTTSGTERVRPCLAHSFLSKPA
jgi:hypothetical protein